MQLARVFKFYTSGSSTTLNKTAVVCTSPFMLSIQAHQKMTHLKRDKDSKEELRWADTGPEQLFQCAQHKGEGRIPHLCPQIKPAK